MAASAAEKQSTVGKIVNLVLTLAVAGVVVYLFLNNGSQSISSPNTPGAAVELTPRPGSPAVGPQLGALAPEITLISYDGKSVRLSEAIKQNKVVLINFWASWCPPCRAEMPDIEAAYSRFRSQGFTVLGVNMQESANQVATYARSGSYDFPLLLDQNGDTAAIYRATSLPTSYFVDSKGVVQAVSRGAMTQAQIEDKLQQLGLSK